MNPQQKELVLLWLMITSRADFSPANPANATSDDILDGIAAEYNANPPGGTWDWDNLTRPTASNIATSAIAASDPFGQVNRSFGNSVLANPASPWPGGGGRDHPHAGEVKAAMGMQN